MKQSGHWFCDNCDDVVFMSYEKTSQRNVSCPVCGHLACNFVPAKLSRRRLSVDWFAEMRRVNAEVSTPELFDQRNHKQIK